MCWKQELAMAVNNLNWAIIHTERAKAKLEKRAARIEKTLEKVKDSPKWTPLMRAHAHAQMKKWQQGAFECRLIIAEFKERQSFLRKMIAEYGISMSSDPARTKELMAGHRTVKGVG